ncbi:MAG TPA: peptidylprolyl isomerase [Pseudolabrys sp.]|nr:peptidylprolyl isomerase [Pseudolabrys sp.]
MDRLRTLPATVTTGFAAAALLAVGLFLAPAAPARAQDDPVLAKVNGVEIRQSDVALAEEEAGAQLPQMAPEARRDYLVSFLSDMVMVAQAAEQQKLADSPQFKRRMAFNRNRLLMDELLQKAGKAAVTDQALRDTYQEAVKQMGDEEEVRARHILVESEDEAKAIVADLKKGANFEELAKTKSKDPGAAAQGGDLGYFTKDQMVPEFSEAAFKLAKGQISEPVKSQFGWHIIRLEDKRKKPAPEFDAVKPQLEAYVTRKAQAELVTKLRESAKVERLDKKDEPKADTKTDGKPNASKPADKK